MTQAALRGGFFYGQHVTDESPLSAETLAVLDTLAAEQEAPSKVDAPEAGAPEADATTTNESTDEAPEAEAESRAGDEPAEKDEADAKDGSSDEDPEKPRRRNRSGNERLKAKIADLEA